MYGHHVLSAKTAIAFDRTARDMLKTITKTATTYRYRESLEDTNHAREPDI